MGEMYVCDEDVGASGLAAQNQPTRTGAKGQEANDALDDAPRALEV